MLAANATTSENRAVPSRNVALPASRTPHRVALPRTGTRGLSSPPGAHTCTPNKRFNADKAPVR